MRAIRWRDLHVDGDFPHVRLEVHKTYRQTGKPRIIPLDRTTVRVLAAMKRRAAKVRKLTGDELIFTNTYGTPWNRHSFARHLRRIARVIGMDLGIVERVTAYCLRTTFVSEAIKAGVGIRQVADVVGHSKTDMVSGVYARSTRSDAEHLGNVAEQIDQARKDKRKKGISQIDQASKDPKKPDADGERATGS